MHSIGILMAKKDIDLGDRHRAVLLNLSARDISDLDILLHLGGKAAILTFLDGPRNAEPRGRKGVVSN